MKLCEGERIILLSRSENDVKDGWWIFGLLLKDGDWKGDCFVGICFIVIDVVFFFEKYGDIFFLNGGGLFDSYVGEGLN